MNDTDFNELLEKYRWGELSNPAERAALRAAIAESPERRRRFLRARQMCLAFDEIPQRKPKLLFRFPSIARLQRFGAMFGNAAVFIFALGLVFQNPEATLQDTIPAVEPATSMIRAAYPADDSATASLDATGLSGDTDAAPYPSEWLKSNPAPDFTSILPVEEYGFVRL